MSEEQKTLEAIIEESMQPVLETLETATKQLIRGQEVILAQGEVINTVMDALIDIAGLTAQAIADTDDPQVRHTLQSIRSTLKLVIDSVRDAV